VPAALAVARRGGKSGIALLTGVLHGFEACCRVGMAVGAAHYRVWHNTATCGPFGSAMAASALLDLSAEQAVHALGNAGTQSSGLWQFLETGAMSKHLHAGRGAEAGVVAADLARLGFTGPPRILEGEKGLFRATCPDASAEALLAAPDGPWQLRQTSIKPWPCCRHTHPSIDAALALSKTVEVDRIAAVRVDTYASALDVCDRPRPDSEYEAKFSVQHCVAAALSDGKIEFLSFDPDSRDRVEALRSRVTLQAADPFVSAYPGHWGASVTVTLDDGTVLEAERADCKGDPESPLTDDEMVVKARYLLAHGGLSVDAVGWVVGSVLGLVRDTPVPQILEDRVFGPDRPDGFSGLGHV
jgi:2-methylcitrate dehydratase PrpD